MRKLTMQEVFNKVVERSKIQIKSIDSRNNYCRYRGDGDTRCFVGELIEDQHYNPKFEGCLIYHLQVRVALHQSGVPTTDLCLSMLVDCVRVHDCLPFNEWEPNLKDIAKRYDLEYAT